MTVNAATLDIACQLKDREVKYLNQKRDRLDRELAHIPYSQPLAGYPDAAEARRNSIRAALAENDATIERMSSLSDDDLVAEFKPRIAG
jgi:hypothetical protein